MAGLGMLAKHNNYIDFGFYSNQTATEENEKKKKI